MSDQDNKFDELAEHYIEQHLESLEREGEFSKNQLIHPTLRRSQIKNEIMKDMDLDELQFYISSALDFLNDSGKQYLEEPEYRSMQEQFSTIGTILKDEKIDIDKMPLFQHVLKISESSMQSIFKIAVAKYQEEDFQTSFFLFVLLAVLNQERYDYWYRIGIAAQKMNNYAFALKAFQAAINLFPDLIGAHYFSIECYLKIGLLDEAKREWEIVKEKNEQQKLGEIWIPYVKDIEEMLNQEIY